MSPVEGDRETQRILIVDDEPAVREALRRSLAFEGYDTETAVDGADALEKATAYRPDLVVLDIQMPRMDGLTAARRIRGAGDTTPILMLTARDTVGDRVTGLDAGADDYLVKPFELDELFARVRALLRRSSYAAATAAAAAQEDEALTFADLRMDLATREVTRGGRAVELTRTEFTLLEMFMAHPRQVLTREQILKAVWGFDFEPSSNSLDVYVMYLRRKTEAGGEPRLVHTVRGVGYVLRSGGAGVRKVLRRYRSLPLRARLSLLVAAAVAFAVAAVSVSCWFVVQGKLYDEVDNDLQKAADRPQIANEVAGVLNNCVQEPSQTYTGVRARDSFYVQLVKEDGTACVSGQSEGMVKVTSSDVNVVKNAADGKGVLRNGSDSKGNVVRVLTVPLNVSQGFGSEPQLFQGAAFTIAVPLKDTQNTLNDLALLLLLVSGIGVVGAGAAGLAVARAALRPVDKLTDAAEHIARTEDLTIRIPVEDEAEDEIARLSRSFNSMTSALANSRDLQQQLIADAGHELRTPLTSLRTNIELLTRSEETGRPIPEADRKALLASVKAQMSELAALIGDLQELSRSDTAQQGDRVQVVDFQDTVESALRRARLRGPELTITADLGPWFVRSEPAALERAIVNILDNAVKFSPEGGTIEVTLAAGVLTVRDHGPGIPADELPHVFDRFWRSPSARALPGSGLGLSIVARTVQQSGGEVALTRAEGGGTLATVRLPGAPVPPPEVP